MSDQEIRNRTVSSQGVIKRFSRFVLKERRQRNKDKYACLLPSIHTHSTRAKIKDWLLYSQCATLCPEPVAMFQLPEVWPFKEMVQEQNCIAGNVVKRVMMVATVRQRLFPVLIARAITLPRQSPALYGSSEKEIQRIKTEKSLPYHEARKLVTSSSSSSSSATTLITLALPDLTTKTVSVDCQTPAFWIGPQPSLREASRLPSVQTSSTGSGTSDETSTHESNLAVTKTSTHVKVRRQNHRRHNKKQ